MEDFIRLQLLKQPRPTADEIYSHLMDYVEEKRLPLPGDSAVIKRITKIRKEIGNHPPSELDNAWSIGACIKHDIPSDIIPMLIELREISLKFKQKGETLDLPPEWRKAEAEAREEVENEPTIRQARWIAKLYPLVEKLIDGQDPAGESSRVGYHDIIAGQYAIKEKLAELKGTPLDTSDLDKHYFIDHNLDIIEGFFMTELPEQYNEARQALENFTPISTDTLEQILGKLTKEQADLMNEWFRILHVIQVHPKQGVPEQRELFKNHPELKPLANKVLKWSVESEKDGEK
ncbi:hypothetical protein ACFLTY_05450 [Chloroflexota bacterium]